MGKVLPRTHRSICLWANSHIERRANPAVSPLNKALPFSNTNFARAGKVSIRTEMGGFCGMHTSSSTPSDCELFYSFCGIRGHQFAGGRDSACEEFLCTSTKGNSAEVWSDEFIYKPGTAGGF